MEALRAEVGLPASSSDGGAHSDLAVHIADWQRQLDALGGLEDPSQTVQTSAAAQEMLQNREANQRVRWPFNHLGGRPERDGADRQAESTATQQEMPTMPNQSPSREQRQREKKGCELQAEHRLTKQRPATPRSRAWQRC